MRVILKKEVPNLGDAGDIVKVSAGYGRNFLMPRGFAVLANDSSVAKAEHNQRVASAIKRKERSGAEALAERLKSAAVTIRREAGEDERLFGSVTNRDIAEALAADDIIIDRRIIDIVDPIKSIGLFTVPVKLHREVEASIRVYVIRA